MSGLDRALEEAAESIGCKSETWETAEGGDSGVGIDYFFGLTNSEGDERFLYVSADQGNWSWTVSDVDGLTISTGGFDLDMEDEETPEAATERMRALANASNGSLLMGTWTSVWEGGHEVSTPCLIKADLSDVVEVFAVEPDMSDDNGDSDEVGILDEQYVELEDGRCLDVEAGDTTEWKFTLRAATAVPS